jgi:hypothetical protein
MNLRRASTFCIIWFLVLSLAVPSGAIAQDSGEKTFTKEELAQLLAPVALYPDSLLAQILMASTYPLEVVKAARWRKDNPDLKEDALDEALKEKDWDVSVKSLCHFPDVLAAMNEQLDMTTTLGDAFLAQEADVMDTIQELRAKAHAAGNLNATEEQKVIVEEKIIIIEPADPQVVYVPVYSPTVVYGTWWYPAYPPYRWYYPGWTVTAGMIGFTAGIFVGAAITGWCGFGWHHHRVDVNINRTVNFNKNVNINRDRVQGGREKWQHNPSHRKSVAYRDKATGERFSQARTRQARTQPAKSTREFRGYSQTGREQVSQRSSQARTSQRESTFSGSNRSGSSERAASMRGQSSRSSSGSFSSGRAGGARSGGARGGGARGGRRR